MEPNNITDGLLGIGILIYSLVQYVTNRNLGERVSAVEATIKTYMEMHRRDNAAPR